MILISGLVVQFKRLKHYVKLERRLKLSSSINYLLCESEILQRGGVNGKGASFAGRGPYNARDPQGTGPRPREVSRRPNQIRSVGRSVVHST